MSASQFPLHRATAMNQGHPVLKGNEMRLVAERLHVLEHLIAAVLNPLVGTEDGRPILIAAHQHAAFLAAYTQPWLAEHE